MLAETVFLIVGREGVESVMFMVAILQQAPGPSMLAGALLGLSVAFGMAPLIFRFGVRINLARFFRVTGVFVLLVAAGLAAGVLRALHEVGIWNALQAQAFDLSQVLPAGGPVGVLLSGIFDYADAPTSGESLAYLSVLLPTLWCFLRPLPPLQPLSGARPSPQPFAKTYPTSAPTTGAEAISPPGICSIWDTNASAMSATVSPTPSALPPAVIAMTAISTLWPRRRCARSTVGSPSASTKRLPP